MRFIPDALTVRLAAALILLSGCVLPDEDPTGFDGPYVEMTKDAVSIRTGQELQLSATFYSGHSHATSDPLVWAAAVPAVLSVSATGLVLGKSAGNSLVTATHGIYSDHVQVTVRGTVASVQITPATFSLSVSKSRTLVAKMYDIRNVLLPSDGSLWSSSNPGVATVNQHGVVVAIAAGTATITATTEGIKGSAIATITSN